MIYFLYLDIANLWHCKNNNFLFDDWICITQNSALVIFGVNFFFRRVAIVSGRFPYKEAQVDVSLHAALNDEATIK